MTYRAIIEFYVRTEPLEFDRVQFVCRVDTTASPPQAGELINIQKRDYVVERTDYSIDFADSPLGETAYRRNVILRRMKD